MIFIVFLKLILGVVTYYLVRAFKYIRTRSFDWHKWLDDNVALFLWNCILASIFFLIASIEPKGFNLAISAFELSNSSYDLVSIGPIVFGVVFTFFVDGFLKKSNFKI